MKTLIVAVVVLMSFSTYAQVGIGTVNPKGALHIDGQQDNPSAADPTVAQQENDVIISTDGRVGIGTTNPTAKLEVKGYIKVGTQEDEVATVPSVGMLRFNTVSSTFEGYVADDGSGNPGWVDLH